MAVIEPWKCECRGSVHPGHFECPQQCAGGHMHVPGAGWVRCRHDGTYEPYAAPDKRNAAAAHVARASFDAVLDARTAAAGDLIEPGDMLECRTAFGNHLWMEAMTLPMKGDKFPIVWVKHAETGREVPWPLDAIRAIRKRGWQR